MEDLEMKRITILGALILLVVSTQAFGLNIPFGDTTIYWNGYPSTDPGNKNDNTRDAIGHPDFLGGTAITNGTNLTSLSFNYMMNKDQYSPYIKPTDLFIDKGADGTWDYLVRLYQTSGGQGSYNLYSINLALNDKPNYVLSDESWNWSSSGLGGNIRNDHPVAIKTLPTGQTPGSVYFDGWKYSPDGLEHEYISTFTFGNGLDVGSGDFSFAWSVTCANDVIMEQVTNSVPEPGTMLLLGIGLMSLVGIGRLKKKS
jgi:hypothetical protein